MNIWLASARGEHACGALSRSLCTGNARQTRRDRGSPATAAHYINAIVDFCESLATFPWHGVPRDDLLPGLRVTHYRKRTVIAYQVNDRIVSIVGVYYGGQGYEGQFDKQPDEDE